MSNIVDLHDYRVSKQKQFFVNLYQFLNKNCEYRLDEIFIQLDEDFLHLCEQLNLKAQYADYFRIPIITFIVTVFIKNSDLKGFFPESLQIENEDNKIMFKNTLIKILQTFEKNYYNPRCRFFMETELDSIIEKNYQDLINMIPERIELV